MSLRSLQSGNVASSARSEAFSMRTIPVQPWTRAVRHRHQRLFCLLFSHCHQGTVFDF